MSRLPSRPLLAAALSLAAAIAHAQTTPATPPAAPPPGTVQTSPVTVTGQAIEPGAYYAPVATTATKTDTPVMETPASVQVVTPQQIEDQQPTRLRDIAPDVSGVYTTSIFQGRTADDFVIRGFDTNQVVYRDGVRVLTGLYGTRDLANVEQVQVLKGPASILYGRIDPGGMVNYITKQPSATAAYSVQQQANSFGGWRTDLGATGPVNPSGTLTYRLDAAYEDASSFRQFVGDRRFVFDPKLRWQVTPDTVVQLEWDHLNQHAVPDNIGDVAFGNRPLNLPISRNLGEPTDYNNSVDDLVNVSVIHDFSANWTGKARFTWQHASEQDAGSFGDFVSNSSIASGIVPRTAEGSSVGVGEHINKQVYSGELDLTGKVTTGPVKHTVLIGMDTFNEHDWALCCGISGNYLSDIDPFAPVHGVTVGPVAGGATPSKTNTQWYGGYLQDQVELPYRIFALAGLRYDSAMVSGTASTATQNDSKLTPRVGLLWQPFGPWGAVYASYSENFGAAQTFGQVDRAGRPLPQETAEQWEGGIKLELPDGKAALTASYFDLTKHNIEAADPLYPTSATIGATIGKANARGVELDAAGEILPGWRVSANYAYTIARVLSPTVYNYGGGFTVPNVPRHGGHVWSTYTVQGGPLRDLVVGGGVTLRSSRQGDWQNDFELPGYTSLDAMARYPFQLSGHRFVAQLNAYNLLNAKYYVSSGEFGRSRIAPGAPLNVLGTVRAEF